LSGPDCVAAPADGRPSAPLQERDQVPLLRRAPRRGEAARLLGRVHGRQAQRRERQDELAVRIDALAQRAGVVVVEARRGPGDAAELRDIERLEVERIAGDRRAR
jgi:hypothetical protein